MARFNYDVNKITRYIDIHKQFQGGLKTVDTDDALQSVYLREAENISLSEFNFIEKRYGLHKLAEHAPWGGATPSASTIVQGYFEYYVNENTLHKIIVIGGKFYIDQGAGFSEVLTFATPIGEVIDLTSIGIYTTEQVDAGLDFASTSYFGTKVPWFYNTNPNGVVSGANGDIIHTTSGGIYSCNSGTSWTQLTAGITFPFPTGLTNGQTYFDTRTSRLYKWNNPTGTNGKLTLLVDVYAADIQTTRPVEGVRIDDKLYIATGTYPVYYQGDGKIYVFPQYQPSDLDIVGVNGLALSYDLNTLDYSKYFEVPAAPINGYKGTDISGAQLIKIRGVHNNYKIGHSNSTPNVKISVDFGLADISTLDEWSTGQYDFDSSVTDPYGTWSDGDPTSGGWVRKAELIIKLYVKNSGQLSTLYQELPGTVYNYSEINNKYSNDQKSSVDGYLAQAINNIPVLTATLPGLTAGNYDFKIELSLKETGWLYTNDNGTTVGTRIIKSQFFEINNFLVTAEELSDYLEDPIASLEGAVHTCNRVIEHNGRLGFFGNPSFPDYVFFSTISAKEYFPYSYSLQFTNELQEPVNAINKFMNILVVQSPSYTWGIKGDCPFPLSSLEGEIYRRITINPTIGCIAPHSVKNVRNQLYFLSKEGIFTLKSLFAEDNRYNVDPIDRNIYNIVPRDTNAISTYFDDQYWLHFPNSKETLRYYVDKKSWVKDIYSAWHSFGGIHKYINIDGNLRFISELSQLTSGGSLKIFDVVVDYSLPTDLGVAFNTKMTTAFLNQNYPFHPKNYKETKLDFTIQNEYNIGKAPIFGTAYAEGGSGSSTYVLFNAVLIPRHFYQITLDKVNVPTSQTYILYVNNVQRATGTFTNTNPVSQSWLPIEFQILDSDVAPYQIKIVSQGISLSGVDSSIAVLKDATYDNSITFTNVVLSEEGTLNIDPIDSYTQSAIEKVINLGTRLGNWTFGTSDFGNVITAVETIKLAGKGYNCKISITETGKSKWTLESLGITYKMKKARSR